MKNNFLYWVSGMIFTLGMFAIYAFKPTSNSAASFEYKQFSTIESAVPGGLGRSRIISTDKNGTLIEIDLLNLYSLVGINFGNISNNDKIIVDKINEYSNNGWELYQVTTGSQTNTSIGTSTTGIFITRYLFRKLK
jgi:hypothetical protein